MMNYFKLFDMEEKFDIDILYIEDKYIELQNKYHPDNNIDTESAKPASDINAGYTILKNDLARAIHMLEIRHIDLSKYDLKKNDLERIWDDYSYIDSCTLDQELSQITEKLYLQRKNQIASIKKYFDLNRLDLAAYLVVRLKYTEIMLEYIDKKELQ